MCLAGRAALAAAQGSVVLLRRCDRDRQDRGGVFAAGDVRYRSIKRVASAVGDGATAVRVAHEYLAADGG